MSDSKNNIQTSKRTTVLVDYGNWIYGFLSFMFPPAGMVLYIAWSKSRRNTRSQIATGLMAFILAVIMYAIYSILISLGILGIFYEPVRILFLIGFIYLIIKKIKATDKRTKESVEQSIAYAKKNGLQIVNVSFMPKNQKICFMGSMISFLISGIFTAIFAGFYVIVSILHETFFCGSWSGPTSCDPLASYTSFLNIFAPLIAIPLIAAIIFLIIYFGYKAQN